MIKGDNVDDGGGAVQVQDGEAADSARVRIMCGENHVPVEDSAADMARDRIGCSPPSAQGRRRSVHTQKRGDK